MGSWDSLLIPHSHLKNGPHLNVGRRKWSMKEDFSCDWRDGGKFMEGKVCLGVSCGALNELYRQQETAERLEQIKEKFHFLIYLELISVKLKKNGYMKS